MFLSRRQFLKVSAGTVAAVALADKALGVVKLTPIWQTGQYEKANTQLPTTPVPL